MEIRALSNGTEYYVDAAGNFAGLVGDPSADAVYSSISAPVSVPTPTPTPVSVEEVPNTETVVLSENKNKDGDTTSFRVEDAFGNVRTIAKEEFRDFKRNNDRTLEMLAGTFVLQNDKEGRRDELYQIAEAQRRAEMGEDAYQREQRASSRDDRFNPIDTAGEAGIPTQAQAHGAEGKLCGGHAGGAAEAAALALHRSLAALTRRAR